VLGPLLFLVFINDIDSAAAMVDIIRKFADNTKVGHKVNNEQDQKILQDALDNLTRWADEWGMDFNIKKCKIVHFGRTNNRFEYTMRGQKLQVSEEERDIGVEVHQSLKPARQCAKAAATARAVLSQIARSFHYRDKKTFIKLYTTYVRPHLEFSTPDWSPWLQTDIKILEKVQEKFVNMLSGLSGLSYEQKLQELNLESLEKRRQQADLVTMHKIMHRQGELDSEHWFDKIRGERITRAGNDQLNVKCRGGKLEVRRNFFSNRIEKQWNSIPGDIKNIPETKKFKCAFTRWQQTRSPCRRPAPGGHDGQR
jgi:ribonucleases P/MRP protein subunit RPP40